MRYLAALFALVISLPAAGAYTVNEAGPYQDPANYTMGWSSAHADGDCVYFLQGHATSGDPNNSVRCFHPADGSWEVVSPDTETAPGEFANDPPQAPNDRDNHGSLEVADKGIFIAGGDGTGKAVHIEAAFFDYGSQSWSDLWTRIGDMEGSWIDGNWSAWEVPFNAATAWSDQLDTGFIYGGRINSHMSQLLLIEPDGDGTYTARKVAHDGGPMAAMRNNAVAVGSRVYIAGGQTDGQHGGEDSTRFRYFDLETETWHDLPDVPVNTHFPQVTYDPGINGIVYFGGHEAPVWEPITRELWVYDLDDGAWHDLTGQLDKIQPVGHPTGAYHASTGTHCYRGQWKAADHDRVFCLSISEDGASSGDSDGTDSGSGDSGSGDGSTSEPVIPANTWVARTIDDQHKKHPVKYGKDMRWRFRPADGKLYVCCGDWGSYEAEPVSGHQEVYSYEVATNTWAKAQSYCTGNAQPSGPDELGVALDTKRDRLWVLPGMQWDHTDDCPSAVLGKTMTWDFTLDGPWGPTGHGIVQNHDQTFAKYDEQTDSIYFTAYGGGKGSSVKQLDVETGEVTTHYINSLGDVRVWREHLAIAEERRALYLADAVNTDALYRFDLDTKEFTKLAPLPIDADANKWMMVYDQEDGVVVGVHDSAGNRIHVYDPDTGAFESHELPTQPSGATRVGNSIGYDPTQDVIVMLGRVGGGGGFENLWLLRYDHDGEFTPVADTGGSTDSPSDDATSSPSPDAPDAPQVVVHGSFELSTYRVYQGGTQVGTFDSSVAAMQDAINRVLSTRESVEIEREPVTVELQ